MTFFAKPRIFPEPFGLGGQAMSVSDYIRNVEKPTWWLEHKETAGSIARNSVYVLPPGLEALSNGDFSSDGTDWFPGGGGTITYPANTASLVANGGFASLTQNGLIAVGDTARILADIASVVGTTRIHDSLGADYINPLVSGEQTVDVIATDADITIVAGAGVNTVVANSISFKKIGELDALITSATVGQAGLLGPNHATDFDGVDDKETVVDAAGVLSAMTTQKWAFLAKADGLGESNVGRLFNWGDTAQGFHYTVNNQIDLRIITDGTDAQAITTVNQILDTIGEWAWIFADYDDTDSLGNGRVIRLFKGIGGIVTEMALGNETPATGTVTAPVDDLIIGNNAATSTSFDGLMDESFVKAGSLWTTAEMQTLVNLAGV